MSPVLIINEKKVKVLCRIVHKKQHDILHSIKTWLVLLFYFRLFWTLPSRGCHSQSCASVSHQLTSRPKLSEMVKCWFSLKHPITYTVTKVFSSLCCCWWRDSEKLMFQYKPETVAYALNHPDGPCKMASNTRESDNTSRWEMWMQEWGVLLSSKVFPILSHSDQVLTAQSSQPLRMRLRQWGTSWTSLTSTKWWTDWGESWRQASLINL